MLFKTAARNIVSILSMISGRPQQKSSSCNRLYCLTPQSLLPLFYKHALEACLIRRGLLLFTQHPLCLFTCLEMMSAIYPGSSVSVHCIDGSAAAVYPGSPASVHMYYESLHCSCVCSLFHTSSYCMKALS